MPREDTPYINFSTVGLNSTACLACRKGNHEECRVNEWYKVENDPWWEEGDYVPPRPSCTCTCTKLDDIIRAEAVVQELQEAPEVDESVGNVRVASETRVVEDVVLRVRTDAPRGRTWLEEVANGLSDFLTALDLILVAKYEYGVKLVDEKMNRETEL